MYSQTQIAQTKYHIYLQKYSFTFVMELKKTKKNISYIILFQIEIGGVIKGYISLISFGT